MIKRILGLDLGTNSIGWALIENNFKNKEGKILGVGSRIVPMSQAVLNDFSKGITKSQTAERTDIRGTRRLYERSNLRRERLHRILNILGFLPEHYASAIDFEKCLGQYLPNREPKYSYLPTKNYNGKFKFLFEDAYEEMELEFRKRHPNLPKYNKKGKRFKLPEDWTLYYLRKKAIKDEISKEELGWILLNFNQKRGYYQERDETEQKESNSIKEYHELKVKEVVETEEKVEGKILYNIIFDKDDGWLYDKKTTKPEDWIGKTREYIVSVSELKDGSIKRTFREVDSESDWEAIKKKTEDDIDEQFIGTYIFNVLLNRPNQKIRGKLVQTIDRDFYFKEMEAILDRQKDFHPELSDIDLYEKAVKHLYPYNIEHQKNLLRNKNLFNHLFLRDVIFYHRPLKSQKGNIARCKFEYRLFKAKDSEEIKKQYVRCMPNSHPLYQEFRIWQLGYNLRLLKREETVDGKLTTNIDVTDDFLSNTKDWEDFFEWIYTRKEIKQQQFISYFIKDKKEKSQYRWNYQDNDTEKIIANETFPLLNSKLDKADKKKLNQDLEIRLWQIIYSVTDKKEYETAIRKVAVENDFAEETVEKLIKAPIIKKEYGAYSEKAIKKLLSLMRQGKYWNYSKIDKKTAERINALIDGEFKEDIKTNVREKLIEFTDLEEFQRLPLWLASYVVYDKHSEVDVTAWQTSKDLDEFIKTFKQHSLRNPIVEQILLETYRTVSDIWKQYAEKLNIPFKTEIDKKTSKEIKIYERVFDEIHVEIGRDLKNPKKIRERIYDANNTRKNTNQRISKILYELKNDGVEAVNPKSKSQLEKLKIFEDGILSSFSEKELKEIALDKKQTVYSISRNSNPSTSEIIKYKAWLEQKYQSPYTGLIIPLSDLFTDKYEIEHIIPQSKFLDNSFNNKIVCESEINKLKDNRTAYGFILEFADAEVPLNFPTNGRTIVKVFSKEAYESFIKQNYDGRKKDNLLQEEVTQGLTERQKTNMRYISKVALKTLSNIVREEKEQESTSKNCIPVQGKVTAILRKEWGLSNVWNAMLAPRFKRLNLLTGRDENEGLFGKYPIIDGQKKNFFLPDVPIEFRADFDIKRIDHRHHAMDALIIAAATRQHVNYINNDHAKENTKRHDLGLILRDTKEIQKTDPLTGIVTLHKVLDAYKKPWSSFTADVKDSLNEIVISFKQNLRAINKNINKYQSYKDEKGNLRLDNKGKPKKAETRQISGKGSGNKKNYAVRKPMHEDTYYGILKNGKNEDRLVLRKTIDTTFDEKKIADVSSGSVRKILLNHLRQEKHQNKTDEKGNEIPAKDLAFSVEGIEDMNKNIIALNNAKFHPPIYKARVMFEKGKKFPIRELENKNGKVQLTKFVKSASGTNLYFCIYKNAKGERKYYVPNFEEILEIQKSEIHLPLRQKKNVPEVHPEFIEFMLLFYLQPNDLVFVPSEDDKFSNDISYENIDHSKLYKFVDGSGTTANFVPMYSSTVIYNIKNNSERKLFAETYNLEFEELIKNEYGLGSPQLKNQNTIDGVQVKSICWKIKVDRLGNLTEIIK